MGVLAILIGGRKSFHPLKGARKVLPGLRGTATSFC